MRARRERGLGLYGMQERAALVGGRLSLDSGPGRGTRVCAEVAMQRGRA
jgi:signal transduction histidine kinase